jgi:RHS repeat-associated protein
MQQRGRGGFEYTSFGSGMLSRSFSAVNYRYSFNGKERDDEVFEGSLAFEARIFDSRLGKFLSLDPRMAEYAWQTPYAYYRNSPIAVLDIAGMGGPYEEDGNTSSVTACEHAVNNTSTSSVDPSGKPLNSGNDNNYSLNSNATLQSPDNYNGSQTTESLNCESPFNKNPELYRVRYSSTITHSFKLNIGPSGTGVTGTDYFLGYYETRTANTVSYYWFRAEVDAEGQLHNAGFTYSYTIDGQGSYSSGLFPSTDMAGFPEDFKSVVLSTMKFKKDNFHESPIQDLAIKNEDSKKIVKYVTGGVSAVGAVLKYVKQTAVFGTILVNCSNATNYVVDWYKTSDPEKLVIHYYNSYETND